jgi:hypothetical protein
MAQMVAGVAVLIGAVVAAVALINIVDAGNNSPVETMSMRRGDSSMSYKRDRRGNVNLNVDIERNGVPAARATGIKIPVRLLSLLLSSLCTIFSTLLFVSFRVVYIKERST